MNNDYKNLDKEIAQNTWATFIYFFSQWLLIIIITRVSGYIDSGTFTLAVSFSNIFSFISRFGMRSVQVGDYNYNYSDGQYFSSRIITVILSLLCFFLTLLICNYRTDLAYSCIAMMGYKVLESFDDVAMAAFQRIHRYDYIAWSYTLKAIFPLLSFAFAIIKGKQLYVCILIMSISYLLIQLLYDYKRLARNTKLFGLSFDGVFPLLKKCFPLVLVSVVDALLIYLPRNTVEKKLGATELGYYGTISIIVVVFSTIAGAIWGSMISTFSEIIGTKNWRELKLLIRKTSIVLILFCGIAFHAGLEIGPFFFKLLFGEEILTHIDLLPYVIANALLLLLNSFFICIFIPLDRRDVLFFSDMAAIIICTIVINEMTVRYNSIGACISLSIALAIRLGIMSIIAIVELKKQKVEGNAL